MKRSILFLAMIAILLSSCFIPDNYEAEVWVHKDGSYEFFYEGELDYLPALEEIMKGEFDDEDLEEMLKLTDDLSEIEGFMEVKHIGGGRFRVDVIVTREAGEDYDFITDDIKLFSFHHNDKGHLVISGPELTDEDLISLKEWNVEMNGELTIIVDKGVKIKSENSMEKVRNKKTGTSYIWELNIDSEKPEMVIK